jgi:hypothetical protein
LKVARKERRGVFQQADKLRNDIEKASSIHPGFIAICSHDAIRELTEGESVIMVVVVPNYCRSALRAMTSRYIGFRQPRGGGGIYPLSQRDSPYAAAVVYLPECLQEMSEGDSIGYRKRLTNQGVLLERALRRVVSHLAHCGRKANRERQSWIKANQWTESHEEL